MRWISSLGLAAGFVGTALMILAAQIPIVFWSAMPLGIILFLLGALTLALHARRL